ncbi:MAG: hypothetical protein GKS05_09405 [Nitrospirales bacterium]|nr:hypothetical protein [Nitrospirales bacterium]
MATPQVDHSAKARKQSPEGPIDPDQRLDATMPDATLTKVRNLRQFQLDDACLSDLNVPPKICQAWKHQPGSV